MWLRSQAGGGGGLGGCGLDFRLGGGVDFSGCALDLGLEGEADLVGVASISYVWLRSPMSQI